MRNESFRTLINEHDINEIVQLIFLFLSFDIKSLDKHLETVYTLSILSGDDDPSLINA